MSGPSCTAARAIVASISRSASGAIRRLSCPRAGAALISSRQHAKPSVRDARDRGRHLDIDGAVASPVGGDTRAGQVGRQVDAPITPVVARLPLGTCPAKRPTRTGLPMQTIPASTVRALWPATARTRSPAATVVAPATREAISVLGGRLGGKHRSRVRVRLGGGLNRFTRNRRQRYEV